MFPISDQSKTDFSSIVTIPEVAHRIVFVDPPVIVANLALEHPIMSSIVFERDVLFN